MDSTAKLGLNLPGMEDYAEIVKLNENFEKLDHAALVDPETGKIPAEQVPAAPLDEQLAGAELKGAPADGDSIVLVDDEDGGAVKRSLWSGIKAALGAGFAAIGHTHGAGDIASGTLDAACLRYQ